LTAFTKLNVDEKSRVHPQYKIHGTATGRLSASDPNPQQFPPPIQECVVADEGKVIIKADYSNIEYRVMAIMTGETWLEEEFNKGVNFHDINTKLLFGIEKGAPDWDDKRRLAKTFIFGLSYGGGINGIYKQIITGSPNCGLTMGKFTQIVKEYFQKLPKYAQWREDIQKQARETRVVSTAFGRKRILLGTEDEISRQALNTPIQGSAGEIAEKAIIELYGELLKKPEWGAELICTVHDSILVECTESYQDEVALVMKRVMEQEVDINGRKCRFPVDIEVGKSWGETKKIEVKEAKAKGGSKAGKSAGSAGRSKPR
jgi:DNA polymerase I